MARQHPGNNRKWYTVTSVKSESSSAIEMSVVRVGPGPWMYFDALFQDQKVIYYAADIFYNGDPDYKEEANDFYRTSAIMSRICSTAFKNFKPKFSIW